MVPMSRQINRSSTGQTAKDAFALGAKRVAKTAPLILIALIALSGCSSHSAPSFVLFGAFFPAWMLCAIIGIFGAIASRGIFVAAGLDSVLPFQLFVCSSVGLVVAAVTWLTGFG
jgi:YtcA family